MYHGRRLTYSLLRRIKSGAQDERGPKRPHPSLTCALRREEGGGDNFINTNDVQHILRLVAIITSALRPGRYGRKAERDPKRRCVSELALLPTSPATSVGKVVFGAEIQGWGITGGPGLVLC